MRCFIIDTVATVVFFTLLAASTELFIAGMDPYEVLVTRLIMIPMMVVTARPYGIWRDFLFKAAKPTTGWGNTLVDSLAFMIFQVPIYVLTLVIAGADSKEIMSLIASSSLIMLVISRPFGVYLELVRKWAGVSVIENKVVKADSMPID
ncbi:L-alanine exporter AlaE [Psychromonas sp. B3M02]|uniref:L-alanine exporter AlaE n=1 Tax=Psychromonas sp. B3M02 TaxID=2267226 RepID=UPI000DEA4574|nr:L-alanine exporter AlaE [Psychromonas sp. B3M02]RBW42777.1 L-alanine exporter AlaE [Psychromonas sp. B3M02]